jgi:hypothetical protein
VKVAVLDFELELRSAMTNREEDLKRNSVLALTMRLERLRIGALRLLIGLLAVAYAVSQATQ